MSSFVTRCAFWNLLKRNGRVENIVPHYNKSSWFLLFLFLDYCYSDFCLTSKSNEFSCGYYRRVYIAYASGGAYAVDALKLLLENGCKKKSVTFFHSSAHSLPLQFLFLIRWLVRSYLLFYSYRMHDSISNMHLCKKDGKLIYSSMEKSINVLCGRSGIYIVLHVARARAEQNRPRQGEKNGNFVVCHTANERITMAHLKTRVHFKREYKSEYVRKKTNGTPATSPNVRCKCGWCACVSSSFHAPSKYSRCIFLFTIFYIFLGRIIFLFPNVSIFFHVLQRAINTLSIWMHRSTTVLQADVDIYCSTLLFIFLTQSHL